MPYALEVIMSMQNRIFELLCKRYAHADNRITMGYVPESSVRYVVDAIWAILSFNE